MSTVYSQTHHVLSNYPCYRAFRKGEVTQDKYWQELMKVKPELINQGLLEDPIHFSTRLPSNEEQVVDKILAQLKEIGVIETTEYPKDKFIIYRQYVYSNYQHRGYSSFIYPEEERLMYALTQILKPSLVILLGSYYGYWGIWAMPAIKEVEGVAYFLDINPEVNQLATLNLNHFGYKGHFEAITQDAVDFMKESQLQYDFAVLDAESSDHHPNPDYRGKAIYYPLIEECSKHLEDAGVVFCHNILLNHSISDPYFEQKIKKNLQEYSKFLPFVKDKFQINFDYPTTEGIGVYQKANFY